MWPIICDHGNGENKKTPREVTALPDSRASGEEASYPPKNPILAFVPSCLRSLGLGDRVGLSPSPPAGKILATSLLMTADARFSRNFFSKTFHFSTCATLCGHISNSWAFVLITPIRSPSPFGHAFPALLWPVISAWLCIPPDNIGNDDNDDVQWFNVHLKAD